MRPIRLKMSAFGPYAGVETIELDALGTEGIYLITGDTGAGKTTLLNILAALDKPTAPVEPSAQAA